MRVLVPGGAGFIGHHTVAVLLGRQHEVIIGSRNPERAARRLPVQARRCERRTVRFEQLLTADAWQPLLMVISQALSKKWPRRARSSQSRSGTVPPDPLLGSFMS